MVDIKKLLAGADIVTNADWLPQDSLSKVSTVLPALSRSVFHPDNICFRIETSPGPIVSAFCGFRKGNRVLVSDGSVCLLVR